MRVHVGWVGFLLAFTLGTAACAEPKASAEAPSIAPPELRARRDAGTAPTVIDVRTAEEFAISHIPGAINIPYDEVADRISTVDAPHGVALYCMVGPRARRGEAALLGAGYSSVLHLEGGLAAWEAAGYPVAASGSPGESPDTLPPSYAACKDPRPEICTQDYRPVCAQRDTGIRCVTTPCDSTEWVTRSNGCSACSDTNVLGHRPGKC